MKFGIFYELQLPKPWAADDERQLVQDALAQVELADRLGIDYAWAVEHHFLEEYSHCSASEVFLAAAAARTKRIRLGHGIRQVIANYNHPARTAEAVAMLDLDLQRPGGTRHRRGRDAAGTRRLRHPGQGEARHGAGGRRADRQHDGDGALSGLRGPLLQDAVPQRAAQAGAEAAPADVDGLHQPRHHQGGGQPRPGRAGVLLHRRGGGAHLEPDLLRHHQERGLRAARPSRQCQHRHGVGVLAARRPRGGGAARAGGLRVLPLRHLRAGDQRCGAGPLAAVRAVPEGAQRRRAGRGRGAARRPCRGHSSNRAASARRRTSARTCAHSRPPASTRSSCCSRPGATGTSTSASRWSCWPREVLPEFAPKAAERERRKAEELAPFIEKALARKKRMPPLADADIPIVPAAVAKPVVNQSKAS